MTRHVGYDPSDSTATGIAKTPASRPFKSTKHSCLGHTTNSSTSSRRFCTLKRAQNQRKGRPMAHPFSEACTTSMTRQSNTKTSTVNQHETSPLTGRNVQPARHHTAPHRTTSHHIASRHTTSHHVTSKQSGQHGCRVGFGNISIMFSPCPSFCLLCKKQLFIQVPSRAHTVVYYSSPVNQSSRSAPISLSIPHRFSPLTPLNRHISSSCGVVFSHFS